MFYKNALFVFPVFWYGFVSVFSGLQFYDQILYQLYNLFFTSAPIMFYALYDYEIPKEEFLKDPKYYQIGFKSNFSIIKTL